MDSNSELKKDLHKYIDNADEKALNMMMEAVVSYNIKTKLDTGEIKPMTEEEYVAMIRRSEKDYEEGRTMTHEAVAEKFRKKYGIQR